MKDNRALIVCDDFRRREFLVKTLKNHHLKPISYPNFRAAQMAIRSDAFAVIVADLSMPMDQKLVLVKEACNYQKDAKVITIEKVDYLKETGALSSFPSVINLDTMEALAGKLED